MKLVTFSQGADPRIGRLEGEEIVDARVEVHPGAMVWRAAELQLRLLEVVAVHVRVAEYAVG